ncbi:MAG: leucine-rich repeat protein, partial [Oscillospiraceae bacterium]
AKNNVNKVTIPNTVKTIERYAFFKSGITDLVIPGGVETIEEQAFSCCSSLVKVTMPSSVVNIGYNAFVGCPALKEIDISTKPKDSIIGAPWSADNAKVRWQGEEAQYSYVFDAKTNTIVKYLGKETTIVIPSFFTMPDGSECAVKAIGQYAFPLAVENVTIPASVETIDISPFLYNSILKEINIPDKMKDTISGAPWGGGNKALVLWKDVVKADKFVFDTTNKAIVKYIGSDTEVAVPASITLNGVPYQVETISGGAFSYNDKITKVTIEEGITSIGESAFSSCYSLTDIDIPKSVTSIENDTFSYCRKLENINIPESVTSIGNGAFAYCSKLENIDIPKSVTAIGAGAFSVCSNLKSITFACTHGNAPKGMPWGAPITTKMLYLGDAINFDHKVTDIGGEYARNINISASTAAVSRSVPQGRIAHIDLPNGTTVSVGETRWPTNGTKKVYKAETNGTYTFKGLSSAGIETVCDVVMDDIGKPTVTAQDGEMSEYDAQRASKQDVCTIVNAAATDSLNKAVLCTISDTDLAKVQALKGGQSTPVTVVATNTGIKDVTGNADITGEKIVNIKALPNPKYEVKFVDFDGKELQKESLDLGTAITAPTNPTRVGYTFTGWTPAVDKTVPAKNV